MWQFSHVTFSYVPPKVAKYNFIFFKKKKKKRERGKKKQKRNLFYVFLFSSPNPAYIQAGIGNHPVVRFEPIKPKIQKPKMGKNSISQNNNNPVARNQTKKKKTNSPAIKPKQQKPSRPLNHWREIIKPKQQKPKIKFKIQPASVSRPDLLHL
jgi:hypothetical protein